MLEKKAGVAGFCFSRGKFLAKYGRDKEWDWYFSLAQNGRSLVQRYNIFSDCFAAMAYRQLFKATGNKEHANIAKETFLYFATKRNPKREVFKILSGNKRSSEFCAAYDSD